MSKTPADDTSGLAAAVTSFANAWSTRDAAAVLEGFDLADPQVTYLPAGNAAPLIGAAAIRRYVEGGCQRFARILMRPGALHLRRLHTDLGLAFFPLAWAIQEGPTARPFGGHVRCTMVLRQTGGMWRAFHYAEAPLAPLLTLQHFYEAVAADGLDAIPRRPS
jgi:ketosteroid isomerase-like protein